jgi:hypothetical protein
LSQLREVALSVSRHCCDVGHIANISGMPLLNVTVPGWQDVFAKISLIAGCSGDDLDRLCISIDNARQVMDLQPDASLADRLIRTHWTDCLRK